MRSFTKVRAALRIAGLLLSASLPASADVAPTGTISLEWDPVPGAHGYRVHYGPASGQYDQAVDVGAATRTTITDLDDCTTHYLAVKAYNSNGDSAQFSNEVVGWARPEVSPETRALLEQGGTFAIDFHGANYSPGIDLVFEATDLYGNPLVEASALSFVDGHRIQALVVVEPTAAGSRAMEIGEHTYKLVSPGGVVGSGEFRVSLNPARLDINRSDWETRDKVDGKDLVWLAFAHGTAEGEERFNPDADLNGDGLVDGEDLAHLATEYGACWSGSAWSAEDCP